MIIRKHFEMPEVSQVLALKCIKHGERLIII
jgi:hypothetical protein